MLPKINQIIYIKITSEGGEENEEYKTRIADMTDDTLSIEIPIHAKTGRPKRLEYGNALAVSFVDENGINNGFASTVVGFADDVVRLVRIKRPDPGSITKMQRRNFLRVPAELEVAVKYSDQLQFVSLTDDVGGGGISFRCDGYIPLAVKYIVSCWLLVPFRNGQIEHIPFKSEIVRIRPLEAGKQQVMMQFTEITDRDRQTIVRFCFERQFENRKN